MRRLALVVLAMLVVCCATAAAAGDGKAVITFSTAKTKARTALSFTATFNPDAQGEQRILTSITLVLPPGTRVDSKAFPQCPLTAFQTASSDPCPKESQVGAGTAHLLLGDAQSDTEFGATVYNQAPGPLIELTLNGTAVYTVDGTVKGNRIVFPLSLAEQIKARTKSIDIQFAKLGTKKKPYLRTPALCPKKKRWAFGVLADVSGGGKIALATKVPCKS